MTPRIPDAYRPPVLNERTTQKILSLVSIYFKTSADMMRGHTRPGDLVKARHTAFWLLYNYAAPSYSAIGRLMNRDHAAIMHGVEQVNHAIKHQTYVHADVEKLKKQVEKWLRHPWKYSNQTITNYTMKALLEQKVNKHLTAA